MLAILLNILKFIPEKIWYGIFNILFDKNTYQNRRHFVRTCIIFIFIGILGIACGYCIIELNNKSSSSLEEFTSENILHSLSSDSFYASVRKEMSSCGPGTYTSKINFAQISNGDYIFAFESLLNDKGVDIKNNTPEAIKLYCTQYIISAKKDIADINLIKNSVHGKIYKSNPQELRYLGSTVFRQLFDRAILQFETLYYKPFYLQNSSKQSILLYVFTFSIVKGYTPQCDPEETLNNIFKYGIIYHEDLSKIKHLKY